MVTNGADSLELASPGETWGGFTFFETLDFRLAPSQVKPPARPLAPEDLEHEFPYEHPRYQRFSSSAALASFVAKRAEVLEPTELPEKAELIGAYAVEGRDTRILAMALNYRTAGSDAILEDPDIWISFDVYEQQPLAYGTFVKDEGLRRTALPARKISVRGRPGVLLEYSNPVGLPRELRHRSVVSWFEPDGGFWTMQARNVTIAQLMTMASSLRTVTRS